MIGILGKSPKKKRPKEFPYFGARNFLKNHLVLVGVFFHIWFFWDKKNKGLKTMEKRQIRSNFHKKKQNTVEKSRKYKIFL